MDAKELKKLLDAIADAGVQEFTLETGEYKLTIRRGGEVQPAVQQAPNPAPSRPPSPVPTSSGIVPALTESTTAPPAKPHLVEVTAPIVGTFYASPSPDAPPYVKAGDRVEAGTVLCIIEAMKLMNEIEAEVAGTVVEVLVRNEEPVEYGQVLFRIDPA